MAFDPTLQPLQEILFANSLGFTSYRLTFNNTANSLQLGIELPGVAVRVNRPF